MSIFERLKDKITGTERIRSEADLRDLMGPEARLFSIPDLTDRKPPANPDHFVQHKNGDIWVDSLENRRAFERDYKRIYKVVNGDEVELWKAK